MKGIHLMIHINWRFGWIPVVGIQIACEVGFSFSSRVWFVLVWIKSRKQKMFELRYESKRPKKSIQWFTPNLVWNPWVNHRFLVILHPPQLLCEFWQLCWRINSSRAEPRSCSLSRTHHVLVANHDSLCGSKSGYELRLVSLAWIHCVLSKSYLRTANSSGRDLSRDSNMDRISNCVCAVPQSAT